MDPNSMFMQSVASRGNMFPGSAISISPSMNIASSLGLKGPEGVIVDMFVDPVLKGMLGPGFLPGQFNPTGNLYDHYRKQAQYTAQQAAMSAASANDQAQYMALIRGSAASMGIDWNVARERDAQMMARDFSRMAPILAGVAPRMFDELHGVRGSAMMMAQSTFGAGRYRVDPITGSVGMSADSLATFNNSLYDSLYGPKADVSRMHGIGAGAAGQLFDELSRRGLGPRALTRSEQLRSIAQNEFQSRGGVNPKDLEDITSGLQKLSSPELESKIRQFEAFRVGDKLRSLSGAVSAMRDIFGEMGQRNAPMASIIEGLQVISQGGLQTMSPQKIEALVRDTYNVARKTGMGFDNTIALMAGTAQRAEALGLNRDIGLSVGLQSSSYATAHGAMGSTTAYGALGKEQMMALDAQLRLNAANSGVGNQLASTVRMSQELGFGKGTEAAALADALSRGSDTYSFGGKEMSVYASPARWRTMMLRSGIDGNVANAYLGQVAFNQKILGDSPALIDISRRLQSTVDIAPIFQRAYSSAARVAGIRDPKLLERIGQIASRGLFDDLSPDELQSPEVMADKLAKELGVSDPQALDQLKTAARLGWGNLENRVRMDPNLKAYKSAQGLVSLQRKDVMRAGTRLTESASLESGFQKALAGLGQGSMLSNLVDALSGATKDTPISDLFKSTLNWVPNEEVGRRLSGVMSKVRAEVDSFNDAEKTSNADLEQYKLLIRSKTETQQELAKKKDAIQKRYGISSVADYEEWRRKVQSGQAEWNGDLVGEMADFSKLTNKQSSIDKDLGSLASKYTDGDLTKLGQHSLVASRLKSRAIENISKMRPEFREAADQAGLAINAPNIKAESIKSMAEDSGKGFSATALALNDLLSSANGLDSLGAGGMDSVQDLMNVNDQLQSIAKDYGSKVESLFVSSESQNELIKLGRIAAVDSRIVQDIKREITEAEKSGDLEKVRALTPKLREAEKRAQSSSKALQDKEGTVGVSASEAAKINLSKADVKRVADLREKRQKLAGGLKDKLSSNRNLSNEVTAEEKTRFAKLSALRGQSTGDLLDRLGKSLGVSIRPADRDAMLAGQDDSAMRSRLLAVEVARLRSGLSEEEFAAKVSKGEIDPSIGEALGDDIVGKIRGKSLSAEDLRQSLKKDLRPKESSASPTGSERVSIDGTLRIEGNFGRITGIGNRS